MNFNRIGYSFGFSITKGIIVLRAVAKHASEETIIRGQKEKGECPNGLVKAPGTNDVGDQSAAVRDLRLDGT